MDWFELSEAALCSRVFPGLRLDAAALLAGVLARLPAGLASEEHQTFVKRLSE